MTKRRATAVEKRAGNDAGEDANMRDAPKRRRLPVIDPGFVTLNHEGFGWRAWMVRLPEGAIADDLKEPGMWERVQATGLALRRHDHLYIVAFDESWTAEAIVADSGRRDVVLTKPRILQFETRTLTLFEDDDYRVRWYGNGYAVERKTDGRRMTDLAPNARLAERDLERLHPRPV